MSKPAPKAEEGADAPASGAKKKKLIIIIVIVAVILAGAGGAAALLMGKKDPNKKEEKKAAEKASPPVFLNLENFVVNLQSDNGEKYLQAGITLQVKNEEQVTYYKTNMPALRSRLLLLMSTKDANELLTHDGKIKLAEEISVQAEKPYSKDEVSPKEEEERKIQGVYFTAFMIQ